jgi:hypothetical protein
MRKLCSTMIAATLLLTFAMPVSSTAMGAVGADRSGSDERNDDHSEVAFTLDEMNCFSSDVRLLEPTATDPDDKASDRRLAGSSDGTNGIPCEARDPKAPPKKKRSRS